jgi:hypothetical protein
MTVALTSVNRERALHLVKKAEEQMAQEEQGHAELGSPREEEGTRSTQKLGKSKTPAALSADRTGRSFCLEARPTLGWGLMPAL